MLYHCACVAALCACTAVRVCACATVCVGACAVSDARQEAATALYVVESALQNECGFLEEELVKALLREHL